MLSLLTQCLICYVKNVAQQLFEVCENIIHNKRTDYEKNATFIVADICA